ncbi:MAG: nitrate reductase maturation protein NarM [Oscillatoriales cyanobacterium SM2_1_8]|nr:nitrate reductase maturation protein NarM [Oscillatoriales cyanobacterium SM2_1_8]
MTLFAFEADFATSLRCIPMGVRYNLDRCGVKLKLQHWLAFDVRPDRQVLVDLPCADPAEVAAYRDRLYDLVAATGLPAPAALPVPEVWPWEVATLPEEIAAKAQGMGLTVRGDRWVHLSPLARFALLKLCRPSHENANFVPALREFGLLADGPAP